MSIYRFDINNITSMATKIAQFTSRIAVNFEITNSFLSISFSLPTLTTIFLTPLNEFQIEALRILILIIFEQQTVTDVYPQPRTIVSPRLPTSFDDNLNGYTVGCALVNTSINHYYICFNNTTGSAVWINQT